MIHIMLLSFVLFFALFVIILMYWWALPGKIFLIKRPLYSFTNNKDNVTLYIQLLAVIMLFRAAKLHYASSGHGYSRCL